MTSVIRASAAVIALLCAFGADAAVKSKATHTTYQVRRGSTNLPPAPTSEAECIRRAHEAADAEGVTRESGANDFQCHKVLHVLTIFGPNPTCPPLPQPEGRVVDCPAGYTGAYTQTLSYSAAPYPTCAVPGGWVPAEPPAGICVPIDSDNDGVPDSADACPTVHAQTPNGCPATPPAPIACANRVCRLNWTHSGTPAEGFRMVYGQRADQLPGSVQVTPGSARTGEVTVTAAGTWYFAVIAFGGGTDSPLSNIMSQSVQ